MGSDHDHGPFGGPYEPRISPDGTRFAHCFDGGTLTYTAPDGLHVVWPDCGGDRLLVPGATGAAFGTMDVPAGAPQPAGRVTLSKLSLRPRGSESSDSPGVMAA